MPLNHHMSRLVRALKAAISGRRLGAVWGGNTTESAARRSMTPGVKVFVPPGHFYSPIVDPQDASLHLRNLAKSTLCQLPGLSIDHAGMVRTWNEMTPFLRTAPFASEAKPGLRYRYENPAYSWADGGVLHAMLRLTKPRRVIEVGCGWSSACTLDTIDAHLAGQCAVTFIEPYPELLREVVGPISANCEIIPTRIQDVSLDQFAELQSDDILFIDSTHVLKTGSDVCYAILDILPRLSRGVLVHFHDIFWPFEYPREWVIDENRSWNELYALRAFLTDNANWEIVFFNDYFRRFELELIAETWPDFLNNSGGALWLRRKN